jgi:uncharacterized membrane protein YgdD (TMEM256/DUF423 family)
MGRWLVALGAVQGFAAVAAAAAAAHLAAGRLDAGRMRAVEAAVQLQGWHALAAVACGLWAVRLGDEGGGALAGWAGVAFLAGSLLFCGAAWASGAAGVSLGPVAPAGGLLLMLGWLLLAVSALRAG